jgi:hypothetical protein
MTSLTARFRPACLVFGLLALPACSGDDGGGGNVLPTSTSDGTDTAGTTASTAGTDSGAMGNMFPATYRFTCIDIQQIGDSDGTVLQANLLESQWQLDMNSFKLNILADLLERNDDAGSGVMQIRSGVGSGEADVCTEANTESTLHDVVYDTEFAGYGPSSDVDALPCSEESTDAMGGSYILSAAATDVFYIYAEDDDGTMFNCVADPAIPNAVPLRAVQATFTQNAEGTRVWGGLSGCLVESEAEALCSCLGVCGTADHEDCGGCQTGSIPLRALLGNIEADAECTATMGAPAMTMKIGFIADLMGAVPMTCG